MDMAHSAKMYIQNKLGCDTVVRYCEDWFLDGQKGR